MITHHPTYREEFTLRDTLFFLKRQKWAFLITMLVVLAIWAAVTFTMQTVYRATTVITLEGRMSGVAGADVLDQFSLDDSASDVMSRLQVLQGEAVTRAAFNQAQIVLPPPGRDVAQPQIGIQSIGASRLASITVDWVNPDEAVRLAAALPDALNTFLNNQRNEKIDNSIRNLTTKMDAERKAVADADARLQKYNANRTEATPEAESGAITSRATALELESRRADVQLASAKENYESLLKARQDLKPMESVATTGTNVDRREGAKQKLESLRVDRQGLVAVYTDQYPAVKAIDRQIREQESVLRAIPPDVTVTQNRKNPLIQEYDSRVAAARASYDAAVAAAATARVAAQEAKASVGQYISSLPQRALLQRDVSLRQSTLLDLSRSVNQLQLRRKSLESPATVVTAAYVDEKPIKPRPLLYLVAALLAGLVLGVGVALLREQADDRVTSVTEAFGVVDSLPAMAVVPSLARTSRVLARKDSPAAYEGLRLLKFNMEEFLQDPSRRVVAVTSPRRRNGHTAVAVNLANQLAPDRKVILIDGDIQEPSAAKAFGVKGEIGLAEVLLGQKTLEEALVATSNPNLRVLPAGTNPQGIELLGRAQMETLIAQIREMADVVVIDAPPVLVTADGIRLAQLADGALLAVRLGSTQRDALALSVERMQQGHVSMLGMVFT